MRGFLENLAGAGVDADVLRSLFDDELATVAELSWPGDSGSAAAASAAADIRAFRDVLRKQVTERESDTAFPCASTAVLPKADAVALRCCKHTIYPAHAANIDYPIGPNHMALITSGCRCLRCRSRPARWAAACGARTGPTSRSCTAPTAAGRSSGTPAAPRHTPTCGGAAPGTPNQHTSSHKFTQAGMLIWGSWGRRMFHGVPSGAVRPAARQPAIVMGKYFHPPPQAEESAAERRYETPQHATPPPSFAARATRLPLSERPGLALSSGEHSGSIFLSGVWNLQVQGDAVGDRGGAGAAQPARERAAWPYQAERDDVR